MPFCSDFFIRILFLQLFWCLQVTPFQLSLFMGLGNEQSKIKFSFLSILIKSIVITLSPLEKCPLISALQTSKVSDNGSVDECQSRNALYRLNGQPNFITQNETKSTKDCSLQQNKGARWKKRGLILLLYLYGYFMVYTRELFNLHCQPFSNYSM